MKKTMTMLLTAAMILSMGVAANAAEAKYRITVDDDVLVLDNGETRAEYQLEEPRVFLSKNSKDGIAISFREEEEGSRKIALGTQKDVTISGELDYLSIGKTLGKEYRINLDEDADVRDLFSGGDARIEVDGELTRAYLNSSTAKLTANKGSEVDLVYARNQSSVKGLLSHHVKPYVDGPEIESVTRYDADRDRYYYYDYDEDGYRYYYYDVNGNRRYDYRRSRYYGYSDLGISNLYDRGDRISFNCEVSGATVRLNGTKLGTTSRGGNTFDIDASRYWDDTLTISKDGYDTETIYLDGYYYSGWRR